MYVYWACVIGFFFSSGQVEKYFKDGSTEIVSPDGTVFITNTSGEKKWNLPDGTVVLMNERIHEKRIMFINGQTEIHTQEFKVSLMVIAGSCSEVLPFVS